MAQAIAETVFDILYLGFALITGLTMLTKGKSRIVKMAGWMTALLGAGDSFHLVPRSYALWTTGMEANAAALGIGKFITSVTMTVFYLILYYIWRVTQWRGVPQVLLARRATCPLPRRSAGRDHPCSGYTGGCPARRTPATDRSGARRNPGPRRARPRPRPCGGLPPG